MNISDVLDIAKKFDGHAQPPAHPARSGAFARTLQTVLSGNPNPNPNLNANTRTTAPAAAAKVAVAARTFPSANIIPSKNIAPTGSLASLRDRGLSLRQGMLASEFYRQEAPKLLNEAVAVGLITTSEAHSAQMLYGFRTEYGNAADAVALGQKALDAAIAQRQADWYSDPAKAAAVENRIQALTESYSQNKANMERLSNLVTDFTAESGAAANLL